MRSPTSAGHSLGGASCPAPSPSQWGQRPTIAAIVSPHGPTSLAEAGPSVPPESMSACLYVPFGAVTAAQYATLPLTEQPYTWMSLYAA
eukprot:CAMPEP_0181251360 /NCGR_PEP_ID=MMETSP1096-20121128/46840_1 /TAXON_ID=156174 ORGANISM="Chrysochromulina ericina, Strain CCMP281" /NCGR_SAMPLE_ID=MMETSP1096 /ASSEMBLY_ACC=CAM_ASM_000453 /LENGTH=88 /DNA_ID=CAMNT_0023348947 /DNA_START=234 /DNA_END=497 /DNA_ORIENTATION=-